MRRVAEELHRLVLQSLCAVGGLAGLWLGFLAAPKHGSDPRILPALAEVLVPVAWHVAAGAFAGAALAWLVTVASTRRQS